MASDLIKEKARQIEAVVFDFDGVLTDNREYLGSATGSIIKSRSHYDGQGISLLRDIGIRVAIATNESSDRAQSASYLVNKWNSLPSASLHVANPWQPVVLFTGVGHFKKAEEVLNWLRQLGVDYQKCAVMGDDLVDVPLLREVGLRAAPVTAELVVKEMADYISERGGGHGAVRDFVNFILGCRGIDQTKLRPF